MKKSRKILIGILILICVIIGSVSYIGYYYVTQNKNEKVYKKLQKEVVKQESKEEEPQTEESHVEIRLILHSFRLRTRIFMHGSRLAGRISIILLRRVLRTMSII